MGMPTSLYPGDDDPMLQGEVVVVDLDEKVVVMPDNVPPLPRKNKIALTKDVQAAVKEILQFNESTTASSSTASSTPAATTAPTASTFSTGNQHLREAFVNFFARLLLPW